MTSTPIILGALLDHWSDTQNVGIIENASALTVSRLPYNLALDLYHIAQELEWRCDFSDAAHETASLADISELMGPYIATLIKPKNEAYRTVLTQRGLAQTLEENYEGILQIAFANVAFATGTTSYQPWGQSDLFSPSALTKSPLDLVRETNAIRLIPEDIRHIILRGKITDSLWEDPAFKIFAKYSAPSLLRCLSTEISKNDILTFTGPPRLNTALTDNLYNNLAINGYRNLKLAAEWVYEDPVSAEQKHALFAAEIARSVNRSEEIGDAFRCVGKDILEGARLAFQLSQSDLSREAIKAQSDLRKSIADDTAKAAESTRSLAGAIAVAIATGITLIAARSTGSVEPWVLATVAGIVAVYLIVVAISGWAFLRVQRELRKQWRNRFYRFIPEDDYKAMVTKPAKSVEIPYHLIATAAILVSIVLGYIAFTTLTTKQDATSLSSNTINTETRPLILNDITPLLLPYTTSEQNQSNVQFCITYLCSGVIDR